MINSLATSSNFYLFTVGKGTPKTTYVWARSQFLAKALLTLTVSTAVSTALTSSFTTPQSLPSKRLNDPIVRCNCWSRRPCLLCMHKHLLLLNLPRLPNSYFVTSTYRIYFTFFNHNGFTRALNPTASVRRAYPGLHFLVLNILLQLISRKNFF